MKRPGLYTKTWLGGLFGVLAIGLIAAGFLLWNLVLLLFGLAAFVGAIAAENSP